MPDVTVLSKAFASLQKLAAKEKSLPPLVQDLLGLAADHQKAGHSEMLLQTLRHLVTHLGADAKKLGLEE